MAVKKIVYADVVEQMQAGCNLGELLETVAQLKARVAELENQVANQGQPNGNTNPNTGNGVDNSTPAENSGSIPETNMVLYTQPYREVPDTLSVGDTIPSHIMLNAQTSSGWYPFEMTLHSPSDAIRDEFSHATGAVRNVTVQDGKITGEVMGSGSIVLTSTVTRVESELPIPLGATVRYRNVLTGSGFNKTISNTQTFKEPHIRVEDSPPPKEPIVEARPLEEILPPPPRQERPLDLGIGISGGYPSELRVGRSFEKTIHLSPTNGEPGSYYDFTVTLSDDPLGYELENVQGKAARVQVNGNVITGKVTPNENVSINLLVTPTQSGYLDLTDFGAYALAYQPTSNAGQIKGDHSAALSNTYPIQPETGELPYDELYS